MGSDHLPIITTVNEQPDIEEVHTSRYIFKRADWDVFKEECKNTFKKPLYNQDNTIFNINIIQAYMKQLKKVFLKLKTKIDERKMCRFGPKNATKQ